MIALGALTGLGFVLAFSLPGMPRLSRPRQSAAPLPTVGEVGQRDVLRYWLRALDLRVLAISVLVFAYRCLFAGVVYGTLGLYLKSAFGPEVGIGPAVVGVASLTAFLLFFQNVVTMAVAPGTGRLSDRLGDRSRLLLLGEALGVAGLAWLALGGSLLSVALGIALVAATGGIVPPLVMSWMGDLSRASRRGATVGVYQTMGDLGSGLGPVVAYWLLATVEIRSLYGLCAAALTLTIPLIVAIRRQSRVPTPAPQA
jgi:MFS family permease